MSAGDLLLLALLGGVLGLDVVSFPQAMVSRPLVAATIAGGVLGQPLGGLLVGATLELIALETLPFGASRYPEWGSAAVVGGGLFTLGNGETAGALTLAVMGALAAAWFGGWTMVMLRRLNARWARRHRGELEEGSYRTVVGLQLFGMTVDIARGALLALVALVLLSPVVTSALGLWSINARVSRAVVVGIAATVAAAAAWKLFHLTPHSRLLFLGGIALGFGVLLLR